MYHVKIKCEILFNGREGRIPMADLRKFIYSPLKKINMIQPECPVYVYGYGLAVQKYGNAAFAQVRLVNRTEKTVHSVFLQIEGKDQEGKSLYVLEYVPLVECMGKAYKDFGEEQPLFLPQGTVDSLEIHVLDVLFDDGMIWRKQSGQKLLTPEEAGWIPCTCGMKNPSETRCCVFCGKKILVTEETEILPVPTDPEIPQEIIEEIIEETLAEEPVSEEIPAEEIPIAEEPAVEENDDIVLPVTDAEELEPVEEKEEQSAQKFREEIESHRINEEPEEVTEAELPERTLPICEEESTPDPDDPVAEELDLNDIILENGDTMQETSLLLQEMLRRLEARESGEDLSSEAQDENPEEETETEKKPEERSRGGFWILMTCLFILLGAGAFFLILYLKGYFG